LLSIGTIVPLKVTWVVSQELLRAGYRASALS
jgi:hypothetical protein